MQSYLPSKEYSSWIALNYEVLFKNLSDLNAHTSVIDLSLPLLAKVWSRVEDKILRAGFTYCASNRPTDLLEVSSQFKRILLPSFKPHELGYATEGLIPVLSSYSEILALSNMAQNHDCRPEYFLRIRTLDDKFGSGDFGHFEIMQKVGSLPMIDMVGAFIDFDSTTQQIKKLSRDLKSVCSQTEPVIIQASNRLTTETEKKLVCWELVGLGEQIRPIAFEAGFWAFPIVTKDNTTLFKVDLGKANGLPEKFVAQIGPFDAKLVQVELDHTIFSVDDFAFDTPQPYKGFLIGSNIANPVSQHSWGIDDLRNFLLHTSEKPLYLINAETVEEILPFRAFSL